MADRSGGGTLDTLAIFSITLRAGKLIAGPVQVYPHHDNATESTIREARKYDRL